MELLMLMKIGREDHESWLINHNKKKVNQQINEG